MDFLIRCQLGKDESGRDCLIGFFPLPVEPGSWETIEGAKVLAYLARWEIPIIQKEIEKRTK